MKTWVGIGTVTMIAVAVVFFGGNIFTDDTVELDFSKRVVKSDGLNGAKYEHAGVINIGFDPRASAEEDARQYTPFLKYLEKATGLKFDLQFAKPGTSLSDQLGEGRLDLAAIGAVTFIHANEKFGMTPLARGLNSADKGVYQSIIVVAPDSDITSIADLRGKKLAFGNKESTQGHVIPRIMMRKNGLSLELFASHQYTGSHQNCANAVILGLADACGMQDTMARNLASDGKVRILAVSEDYPSSGIAARKGLPADVLAKIRKALLAFDPLGRDKADLYNWKSTEMPNGFTNASAVDYASMREHLRALGLLN